MKFHDRFDIVVPQEEARKRFVNRALNDVFTDSRYTAPASGINARKHVATALGKRYIGHQTNMDYYTTSFHECLLALEAAYTLRPKSEVALDVSITIENLLERAEADLGVKWENGQFVKTGVPLLDDRLINDQLRWLREYGFESFEKPFEKALRHLLEGETQPSRLSDAVTDAYEALEAVSKLVTGRHSKDLSATAESFASKLTKAAKLRAMIKEYIAFVNFYRHAAEGSTPKPQLTPTSAECVVYSTGALIRFSIESGDLWT